MHRGTVAYLHVELQVLFPLLTSGGWCERGSVFENAETVTSSNKGSVATVHSAALDLENLLISR